MRKILFAALAPAALIGWTAAGANPPAQPTEQPKPADDGHHDDGKGGDHHGDNHGEKPAGDHH